MNKFAIGFHTSTGGNKNGLGAFIQRLNAAGLPVMIKATADAGPAFEAQESGKLHDVDNLLIYRATNNATYQYDTPRYDLPPSEAAYQHWQATRLVWPPELDPSVVWMEPINEPRAKLEPNETTPTWGGLHPVAWLGRFMVEYASIANGNGFKVCGPSFSSGDPEVDLWQLEGMADWLRYCADNPDKAAISHHEYNYGNVPFADNYPWHYGRFQAVIAAADLLGIPRTFSVFLTEFGWTYETVPSWETTVPVLTEYAKLAAKFPQLKGVALWTLQMGWGGISDQLAQWISDNGNPLANWIISNQYPALPQPQPTANEFGATLPEDNMEPTNCDLYLDLGRFVHLLPQDTTDDEIATIARQFNAAKNSFVYSHDDAELIVAHGRGENPDGKKVSEVRIWEPERFADDVIDYFSSRGYKYSVGYFDGSPPAEIEIIDIVDELPKHATLKYATRPLTGITTLTIHHTVSPPDRSIESIASYHVNSNGWPGIGYHFVIKDDGRIYQTNYLETKSYHAGSYTAPGDENAVSVGVTLQGDFTNVPPPQAQLDAARELVVRLKNVLPSVTAVLGHRQMPGASTACPGATWAQWLPYVAGDEIVVPEPPPPPPPVPTIDVAPYFVPAGQYGPKIVMQVNSGTQPLQLEKRANDVILRKGDGNWIDGKKWQDSEQWRVVNGQVQKGKDTSDAGNGGRDGYDLGWAQWIPQFVQVGQTYHSTPTVKRFDRTNNCQVYSTAVANDYLTIKAIIPTWVSPANSSIVLNDVLIIEWRSGTPDLSKPPNEVYYFAKGYGYVGWGNHFIVEITQGQAPLTGALDCGM